MFGIPAFITGTLSPVSMLSFTIAAPVSKIKSQGKFSLYGISMTSPGTKSELSISLNPLPNP